MYRNAIPFAREMCIAIEPFSVSKLKVQETLDMVNVVEDTRFGLLPTSWRRVVRGNSESSQGT